MRSVRNPYCKSAISYTLFILFIFLSCRLSNGQQSPFYPVSHRIFNPFIINPAVAGSKDFTTVDFNLGKHGNLSSQIVSLNARLTKPGHNYFSSYDAPQFTNIGVGGMVFNEINNISQIVGIGATGSYHLKLDRLALSYISFGASVKALYNIYPGDEDLSIPAENTFFPNLDLGLYYYSPFFFAGISATNILGSPAETDSLGFTTIPVSSQYYLNVGTKFILLRSHNILIEPSILLVTDDSFSQKPMEMIKPALTLYFGKFCMGSYLNSLDDISFFFQFRYPKVNIGAYFEFERNSPFYKTPPIAEIAVGINLTTLKSGVLRPNHW
jgi:type IX secretion system PorP/SprF family membrane protein